MVKLKKQRIIDNSLGKILCFSTKSKKYKKRENPEKIIVYRLSAIGDSILLLPMLKRLKEKNKSEIIVVCSKENKVVFENQKFVDKIILFENNTLNPFKILKFIKKIKAERPDVSIDTTQSLNFSAFLSNITSKYNIGFENVNNKVRNKNYSELIKLEPNGHVIWSYFDLLKPLEINRPKKPKIVKPKTGKNEKIKINEIFKKNKINNKKVVGIHAQTLMKHKMWPLNKWAKLVTHLTNKNYNVILIGSENEKDLSDKLMKKIKDIDKNSRKKIVNLVGKTNLKETIALMPYFKFFLANDGGPMHIAASFNLPVIGLFGPETPERYAPFNKKSFAIYKGKDFKCSPCIKRYDGKESKCENPVCLKKIKIKDVKESIKKIERILG